MPLVGTVGPRRASGLLALLLAVTGLPVAAVATATPAAAAIADEVTCSTDSGIFSTGYDAATGGKLTSGDEPSWDVAYGSTTVTQAQIAADPPTVSDIGTWTTPIVNKAAGVWVNSPYSNANWIATADSPPSYHYVYYRLTFTLADDVDPAELNLQFAGAWDDALVDIWINGDSLSSTSTVPTGGFTSLTTLPTLSSFWQAGENEIIVVTWNQTAPSGLLLQSLPVEICRPLFAITKTVSKTEAEVGDTVDYTITASNKGTVDATNITVVDTPPDSGLLSIGAWTCAASGGAACPNAGGTGAVDETIASLPLGSSLTYSFSATVLAGGGTHIVNTATLTSQLANYGCSGSAVTPCTATATLIGRYKPPVAVDDAANAYGDPVAVAVLDNDSDPDDAALSVDSTTNPSQGSATVDGDVVIYTPDPTAIGTDTFTYTISNAHGLTATATVTITDHLTLTYDPNEGTGTVPDAVTTAVADQSVADGDSLARHGYRFTGWNTSADGTGDGYAPGDTIDLSTIGNVTLYAQWAQVESNQTASPSTDSNSDLASTGADGIPFLLAAVLLALTGGIVLIGIARRSRN